MAPGEAVDSGWSSLVAAARVEECAGWLDHLVVAGPMLVGVLGLSVIWIASGLLAQQKYEKGR